MAEEKKAPHSEPSTFMTKMTELGGKVKRGMIRSKHAAFKKYGEVPISAEDEEVLERLDRYKSIKMKMALIPDLMRTLYDVRMREARYLDKISHAFTAMDGFNIQNDSDNSNFNAYMREIGDAIMELHQMQTEHLRKMEQKLVIPFEEYRDNDIAQTEDFKVCKYKEAKMAFDLASFKVVRYEEKSEKLKNSDYSYSKKSDKHREKTKTAYKEKDAAWAHLEELRKIMIRKVDNLEKKQEQELLKSMKVYWATYAEFVGHQNELLSPNGVEYGMANRIQGIVDEDGAVNIDMASSKPRVSFL